VTDHAYGSSASHNHGRISVTSGLDRRRGLAAAAALATPLSLGPVLDAQAQPARDTSGLLVLGTDFGLKDGAVAAMPSAFCYTL
jgi:hypothetical protein